MPAWLPVVRSRRNGSGNDPLEIGGGRVLRLVLGELASHLS